MAHGLSESPAHEVLIEESVEGWKEFELEVMRDRADNVIIVCSIENFDAMGIHTGDSITVAPQMTLSDRQYQEMRNEAKAVIRKVGVDTGGSNIQFAVEPITGRRVVIEMNPRVSRSSALASKATGFPIAKIAALLAVGYTLDEIPERHHEEDAGLLRALARLRRREDSALDVREVPARRSAPDDPDEVRGRGHGDRPDLRRGVRQGDPVARDRARRPGRRRRGAAARRSCSEKLVRADLGADLPPAPRVSWRACRSRRSPPRTRIDPWFLDAVGRMVDEERASRAGAGRGSLPRGAARGQAARPLGPARSRAPWAAPRSDVRERRQGARARARLQDDRHLRGGVRGRDAVLLLDLRGRERVAAHRAAQGRRPRRRARTGSARASSSTTAACTPATRSPRRASRPS